MTPRKAKGLTPRARRMGATQTKLKGLLIRLDDDQEAQLERAASMLDLPLATWARRVLLHEAARQDQQAFGPVE